MRNRDKILTISFFLSLPFWLLVNALDGNLKDFWFLKEISANQGFLNASINDSLMGEGLREIREERVLINNLNDLEVNAKAAIVVEVDSEWNGEVLLERNSYQSYPIASLSKLMTALVVLELKETYDLSKPLLISQEAVDQEGSSKYGNFTAGERLSIESLLNKMLIESNNDSAFALAEYIGERPFVDLMNLYARKVGLTQTSFINSTGLDSEFNKGNLSSVENLANLAKYVLQNHPQIFEITTKQSYTLVKPDGSVHHVISQNTNELLSEYPEIIGGKTGWTPLAGGCLLEIVEKPDRDGYYIAVILGANDRFGEMKKILGVLLNK